MRLLPSITALDDRGKRVGVVAQRHLSCEPHVGGPLPLAVRNKVFTALQNARRSPTPEERRADVWLWVAIIISVAVQAAIPSVVGPLSRAFGSRPVGLTVGILVFGLAYGVVWWAVITAIFRRNAQRIARAIAAAGHCPTCGYSFAGIDAAADGCIVCPECGGAWRDDDPMPPPRDDSGP